MSFRHDSRGIDPDQEVGRLLLPDGWYTFKIKEAEEQVSKKGNDMILCKCVPVGEPQYKDAEVRHWVVFLPKESPGAGISVQFRKAIKVPFGGDDLVDAEDWVGKKFSGYVITDSYTNDQGKTNKNNKINNVRSLEDAAKENGAAPAGKGSSVQAETIEVDDSVPF